MILMGMYDWAHFASVSLVILGVANALTVVQFLIVNRRLLALETMHQEPDPTLTKVGDDMLWKSVEMMFADSYEFVALTGSLPTFDQLVRFAEHKRGPSTDTTRSRT